MGVVCRLHFGKGLPRYCKYFLPIFFLPIQEEKRLSYLHFVTVSAVQTAEILEGVDFAPVYVSKDADGVHKESVDIEKDSMYRGADVAQIESLPYIQPPKPTLTRAPSHSKSKDQTTKSKLLAASDVAQPPPGLLAKKSHSTSARDRAPRVPSVYSDNTRETVKLSSTPPLFKEESPMVTDSEFTPAALERSSRSLAKDARSPGRDVLPPIRTDRNALERHPARGESPLGSVASSASSPSSGSPLSISRSLPGGKKNGGLPSNPRLATGISGASPTVKPAGNYF